MLAAAGGQDADADVDLWRHVREADGQFALPRNVDAGMVGVPARVD